MSRIRTTLRALRGRRAILIGGVALVVVGLGTSAYALVAGTTTTTTTTTTPSTTSTTTTTTTTTTITTVPQRTFTMAFGGDILIHRTLKQLAARTGQETGRAHDFRPFLRYIKPLVERVDWAVCHMETPVSNDNTRLFHYPVFRVPTEIVADLKEAGYDSCSTASNHTIDMGVSGVIETLGVFDDAGLRFSGSARNAEEVWESRLYDIKGVKVAHLSYTWSFNGFRLPKDVPWTSQLIDEELILADAAHAKDLGAEFVVLSLHWGNEYRAELSAQQQRLGPILTESPNIDLIVGHHAHQIQRVDKINGKYVVYGLGNQLSNQNYPPQTDQLFVTATMTEKVDGSFGVTELRVTPMLMLKETKAAAPAGPVSRPDDLRPDQVKKFQAAWLRMLKILKTGTAWYDMVIES